VPLGSEDVATENGGGLLIMLSEAVAVCEALSVARTVKVLDPAAVGVPEMVAPVSVSPAGKEPLASDHEYGGLPPDAASDCEYAVPTTALGSDDVVTVSVRGVMVIVSDAVAVCDALSVARTVKVFDPAAVGVPAMVAPESVRPAGKVPLASDHVYGAVPPDAASDCEYAVPTTPFGSDDVVTVSEVGVIVIVSDTVAVREPLSVARTVKVLDPAAVGVPAIVAPVRVSPAGNVPLASDQVYGAVPPDAASDCEYAVPTTPFGNDDVVTVSVVGVMVIVSDAVAIREPLSVARTVKVLDPAAVGVPAIVAPVSVSPAGRVPLASDQVYGAVPPDAASDCEYAVPTTPFGNDDVVIDRVAGLMTIVSDAVAVRDALSVARTVKVVDPAAVGVPAMVAPVSVSPAGKVPLARDHA